MKGSNEIHARDEVRMEVDERFGITRKEKCIADPPLPFLKLVVVLKLKIRSILFEGGCRSDIGRGEADFSAIRSGLVIRRIMDAIP